MPRPPLSVQLYTVRDLLVDDPAGTLRSLAGLGLTAVEPYALLEFADVLEPALGESGLTAPTAHVSLVATDVDLNAVFAAATRLGVTTLFEPMVPETEWTEPDAVVATARSLNAVARRAATHGIRVGYHNHWWELEHHFAGVPALRLLADELDDEVLLEVDAYWAAVGGVDPVALITDLGSRVAAIHVKDGPISRDTEAQLPAGTGALPLAAILAAAPEARPVLEFDAYAGDILDGLAASVAGYRALTGNAV